MQQADVIIVGGGPGGSACAWRLKQNKVNCLIIDQQKFPRFKPCAGWVTPAVLRDLGLQSAEYSHSFTTFASFEIVVRGFHFRLPTRQHAIRRFEFDDFLLRRAGAPVVQHSVKSIQQEGDGYVIDGQFCAKYLVGAGGTHDPVYRGLFQEGRPKAKDTLVVAQEEEFLYPYSDPRCWLWFLENRLPGYAWYVPKANGYLNVGVGGKADELKANGDTLKNHWNRLVEKLDGMGLVRGHSFKPSGHSYYLRQRRSEARRGNAFLVGDAAGLATLDMGEGISPAIKSGLLAADAILGKQAYSLSSIPRFSLISLLRLGRA